MKKIIAFFLAIAFVCGCGGPQPAAKTEAQPSSQNAKDLVNEGIAFLKDANPTEAIKSFDEAIKLNPYDPDSYMILGETYMRMQQYDRAVDSFTAATRVAPEKGELYYLLAVNQQLAGNHQDALTNAQKSVEIFRRDQDEENFKKSLALLQGLMGAGTTAQ